MTEEKATRGPGRPRKDSKGQLTHYVSEKPAYVGGKYYRPGQPFVTDAEASDGWEKITPKAAAAVHAATDRVPDDANLEAASKAALEAVAIMKHVNIDGLDKPALIDAIKAAYEPKL